MMSERISRILPVNVLDLEWDTLIILDACRADYFERVKELGEQWAYTRRTTVGSSTPEFLDETFTNQTLYDTVYVTANPQPIRYVSKRDSPAFHDLVSVLDAWDEQWQTIVPEQTSQAAKEVHNTYPQKRVIVHFLQPHAPFIGPNARQIQEQTGSTIGGLNPGRDYTDVDAQDIEPLRYPEAVAQGVSIELIREAYRDTLRSVAHEAVSLAEQLNGRIALTADHGELLGERLLGIGSRSWEHPSGSWRKPLRRVPYAVLDRDRRNTKVEPPKDTTHDTEQVHNQLAALGYT